MQLQYNTVQQPYNNVQPQYNRTSPYTISRSTIRHHGITFQEVIEQAIEEEDELKEVLDGVEDQSHVTIISNQNVMHENVHFHQPLVCIVVHRTMIQRNVQH
jgi:hypothetical protein